MRAWTSAHTARSARRRRLDTRAVAFWRIPLRCYVAIFLGLLSLTRTAQADPPSASDASSDPSSERADTQRARGFSQSRSTQQALEQQLEPRRVALLIGINRYQDPLWGSLKHAVEDARALSRVLMAPESGDFDTVRVLDAPQSTTRDAIFAELKRLKQELRKQDTFLFYFSGHGTAELTPEGQPVYYLVSSDARGKRLADSGIELSSLLAFLQGLKSSRTITLFDSCFSGEGRSVLPGETRERLASSPNPWAQLSQTLERSESIMMATGPGGVAHEDDRLGHGIFTFSLLQALTRERVQADANGDGAVTPYEANDFARILASDLSLGKQAPEGFFRVAGKEEVYLSGKVDPKKSHHARIYAYGSRLQKGLKLEVDGRPRGAFPRTVAIDPGVRSLAVVDEAGAVVAEGRIPLLADETLGLDQVVKTLRTPPWVVSLQTGHDRQLLGSSASIFGTDGIRLELGLGHRIRGGVLSGAQLRGVVGLRRLHDGAWEEATAETSRTAFDVGLEAGTGRTLGPIRIGMGWHVHVGMLPPVGLAGDVTGLSPQALAASQGWAWLEAGPAVRQEIPLSERVSLVLRQRLATSRVPEALAGQGSTFFDQLVVQGSVQVGLEVGFNPGRKGVKRSEAQARWAPEQP